MYLENNITEKPLSHYLDLYKKIDPVKAASRCDVKYDKEQKQFMLELLGQKYYINYPEFSVEIKDSKPIHTILVSSVYAQILIIRYLIAGKAIPFMGKYCSYREFPWGEVYYRQFYERCIVRTASTFGKRPDNLKTLMHTIKGKKIKGADYSYELEFIKGLYMKFLFWEADDEFPPSAQILFSDNFHYAFSAEDLAVIGDVTIGMFKAS